MKCSNPDCDRGIGLVAYQRGWLTKRRYCSRNCRDAFVVDRPRQLQPEPIATTTSSGFFCNRLRHYSRS